MRTRLTIHTAAAILMWNHVVPTVLVALQDSTDIAAVMAAAEGGDPEAQYELGWMYSFGTDVPTDRAKSAQWYRRAADQGHAGAQVVLGIKYEVGGVGVPQDYAEAMHWYRRAAEQGDAPGQSSLARMYRDGLGVPQDYAEAARWYRRAAEQGNTPAQFELGAMHDSGLGVPQDYAQAARWYRRAAVPDGQLQLLEGELRVTSVGGRAAAQNNLGVLYAEGRGVAMDESEAVQWYRRAAYEGLPVAQFNLGVMYADGRGVAQNEAEAAQWYRRAAKQDNDLAQHSLGVMYAEGRGVLKDSVLAHMWFNIAGANGNQRARMPRDALEEELTRAEIGRATELARACMASEYETCEP